MCQFVPESSYFPLGLGSFCAFHPALPHGDIVAVSQAGFAVKSVGRDGVGVEFDAARDIIVKFANGVEIAVRVIVCVTDAVTLIVIVGILGVAGISLMVSAVVDEFRVW
jgi:hypothetical protein